MIRCVDVKTSENDIGIGVKRKTDPGTQVFKD